MKKITNIIELRDDLLAQYDLLKSDPRRLNQIAEEANVAGKIIATAKLQMEYSIMRGELPEISFMGPTSGKVIKSGASIKQQLKA